MATVIRRRRLVNPHRRRKLSAKQIKFFGTARQRAALRGKRKNKAKAHATPKRYSAPRPRKTRRRRNISGIATIGLPFLNPSARRSSHRKTRKKKTIMAKSHTRKRRRSTAHKTTRRRRKTHSNPGHFARRHRRRTIHARRRRHNPRRHYVARRRRHNPRSGGSTNLLKSAVLIGGGAVGSRWLTQLALGPSNSGLMGYGGNAIAGLVLGWAGGKFLGGRSARNSIFVGTLVGMLFRAAQDFTPWGKALALSGVGDAGMGALMPSSFVDPALFTGNGAQRRIPPAWAPPVVAQKAGMGASSYGFSTYR